MAACRRFYRGGCCFSSFICQNARESNELKGIVLANNLSTSQVCHKKTPHTVGVPAWAKAGQRRLKDLMEMKKPKSAKQIQAEYNLANDPTELKLYTTSKQGTPPDYNSEYDSQIEKAKITMSADQSMFVCYHPAKPFPLQFSKEIGYHVWWQHDNDYMNSYRDKLTEEEVVLTFKSVDETLVCDHSMKAIEQYVNVVKEVRELRQKDIKMWTVTALSNMLQVKPLAIILAAPLTDEQKFELEVERKLLSEWPKEKRKTYRANQELERLIYYQRTRITRSAENKETVKETTEEDKEPQDAPSAKSAVN